MRTSKILLLSTVMSTFWVPAAAYAEDAGTAESATQGSIGDGEIIVTARRRSEELNKVPISISAFSAETLERKSITSTRELTKITPGLNVAGASSLSNPFITIRGMSRAASGPGAPGVVAYMNDVPLPTYGSIIPTFDMEGIQVLKGPQGTLFGRNAIGGAVLSNTRKPTYDFGGYAQAEYGRFNSISMEAAVNLPVVKDMLAVRLAAQISNTDGYTTGYLYSPSTYIPGNLAVGNFGSATPGKFLGKVNFDQRRDRSVRGSVLFEPGSGISNLTVVDWTRMEGGTPTTAIGLIPGFPFNNNPALFPFTPTFTADLSAIYVPTFQCTTPTPLGVPGTVDPGCNVNQAVANMIASKGRTTYSEMLPLDTTTRLGVTNTTTIDIGDMTLKNIFGLRKLHYFNNGNLDGVAQTLINVDYVEQRQQQITDELQLSGEALDSKLKYVFGGFYYKLEPKDRGGFQTNIINVFGGLSNSLQSNFLTETSKALYGQLDYEVIPNVTLTAGLRKTWDTQATCIYVANYAFSQGGTPTTPGVPPYIPTVDQCRNNSFTIDSTAVPSSQSATSYKAKFSKATWTLSAAWQATPEILLYGTARRGYRSGGINSGTFATAALEAALREFSPEVLDDIEIGTKGRYDLGGIRGTFSLSGFRSKDKGNQQFQLFTGLNGLPANGSLLNKADITFKGVEASLTVSPLEGLTLGGNLGYTHWTIDKALIPQAVVDYLTATGQTSGLPFLQQQIIPNQPHWTANANIEYVGRDAIGGGDLILNVDWHHQTGYVGTLPVPGYDTGDARITLAGLGDGKVDISAFVRNFTNKLYYLGPATAPTTGILSMMPAAPRTFGVSVKLRFGE